MGGYPAVILLDTHVWVWLADESEKLSDDHREAVDANREHGLGVSAISCWEVAKLVELTPRIAIESTQLPGEFHSGPADQLIVATARVHGMALATEDRKIRSYEHVDVI